MQRTRFPLSGLEVEVSMHAHDFELPSHDTDIHFPVVLLHEASVGRTLYALKTGQDGGVQM